ncbi:TetR/AcrR family transcriptional regulator [Actinacidiphila glaucinigra]|uniref:TetR/AcrR family transcriptional regulator n=1 Tax=Actinacidiphila glaucinigra TaxID=235986 RepID=UPI000B770AD3
MAEADVARGTFYRHVEGKDDLVRAYLEAADREIRGRVSAAEKVIVSPADVLATVAHGIGEEVCGAEFRGCPFITPRPSARTARALSIRRCCDTTPGSARPCRQMSSPSYRWEVPPPPGGRAPWFPQLALGGAPRCGASQGGESSS